MHTNTKYAAELVEIKEFIGNDPDRYYDFCNKVVSVYEDIIAAMENNDDVADEKIFDFIRLYNADIEDVTIDKCANVINICKNVFRKNNMIHEFLEYCKLCSVIDVNDDATIIAAFEYNGDHPISSVNNESLLNLIGSLYYEDGKFSVIVSYLGNLMMVTPLCLLLKDK